LPRQVPRTGVGLHHIGDHAVVDHHRVALRAHTHAARDDIIRLYDERFFRLWEFYLAGASGAFRYGGLVNFQLQYARNRGTLPITRDYMRDAEHLYRQQAGPAPK
jgi:hypothetical protein